MTRFQYKTAIDITEDVIFMSRVRIDPDTGFWNWTHTLFSNGYARIKRYGKDQGAHRYAYEKRHGKVSDELFLDHLCRNPKCVNPKHLEPVTPFENQRRGLTFTAAKVAQTHCLRWHPLSGDNLFMRRNGHRACWICHVARTRKSQSAPKAKARHAELERIRRSKKNKKEGITK